VCRAQENFCTFRLPVGDESDRVVCGIHLKAQSYIDLISKGGRGIVPFQMTAAALGEQSLDLVLSIMGVWGTLFRALGLGFEI